MKSNLLQFKTSRGCVFSTKYHVIFCPKYRRSVLTEQIAERFKSIANEAAENIECEILEMEVMPDHVHLLVEIPPKYSVHNLVSAIKGRSSRFLRQEFPELKRKLPCLWSGSYFCATVGGAPLEVIKNYIQNQKNV